MRIFTTIQERYPQLKMELHLEHRYVEIALDIPAQEGISLPLFLHLQYDELSLCAGACQLEWFPCTNAEVAGLYESAVRAILDGKWRVVESYRGGTCVSSVLESPQGTGWQREGTSGNLLDMLTLCWLPEKKRVLQNKRIFCGNCGVSLGTFAEQLNFCPDCGDSLDYLKDMFDRCVHRFVPSFHE